MQNGRGRPVGTLGGLVERWSTSAPFRWRELTTLRAGRGMPGGTIEQAVADGVERTRQSWDGKLRSQKVDGVHARFGIGLSGLTVPAPLPDLLGRDLVAGVADPRATVAEMVARGEVEATGTRVREGRRLLRFVGQTETERTGRNAFRPATRTIYLVDPETYAPVEVTAAFDLAAPGSRGAGRFNTRATVLFDVYENLPLGPDTAPLLRLGGPTG
jgi:hypothetical protein